MKILNNLKATLAGAVLLLGLGGAAQAATVSEGFASGTGVFDSGSIDLDAGTYTMELTVFTFGSAGPFLFGIANSSEAFQVAVDTFGQASTVFTTVGGTFDFLVGGVAGLGSIYNASITVVPLPAAVWLLGSAMVGLVVISRRKSPAV